MRMPFGKYRGQRIADLPADYLEWLLTSQHRTDAHHCRKQ